MARSLLSGSGSFKGLDRKLAKLERMSAELKSLMRDTLEKQVNGIADNMRAIAWVDPSTKHPYALRDGIVVRQGKHELAFEIEDVARDEKGRLFAAHVEFGHKTASGAHVPPKPFFFKAREAGWKRAKAALAAAWRAYNKATFG